MRGVILLAVVTLGPLTYMAVSDADPLWVAREIASWDQLHSDHPGPLEFIAQNTSTNRYAMTEIRALNDQGGTPEGCAVEIGTTGTQYNDPTNGGLSMNTSFLVFESGCQHPRIKNNNESQGLLIGSPKHSIEITPMGGVRFPTGSSGCPSIDTMVFCMDRAGTLWITPPAGPAHPV